MNICIEKVHYINPLRDKRWADYTVKRLITTLHRQSRPRVSQTVECFQDDCSPQRSTHALNHLKHNLLIFFQIFKLWISFWFNFRWVLESWFKKNCHKITKFWMVTSSMRKSNSEHSTSSSFIFLALCVSLLNVVSWLLLVLFSMLLEVLHKEIMATPKGFLCNFNMLL